jgi:hypothetical protein
MIDYLQCLDLLENIWFTLTEDAPNQSITLWCTTIIEYSKKHGMAWLQTLSNLWVEFEIENIYACAIRAVMMFALMLVAGVSIESQIILELVFDISVLFLLQTLPLEI